jgi:hypothetical protein
MIWINRRRPNHRLKQTRNITLTIRRSGACGVHRNSRILFCHLPEFESKLSAITGPCDSFWRRASVFRGVRQTWKVKETPATSLVVPVLAFSRFSISILNRFFVTILLSLTLTMLLDVICRGKLSFSALKRKRVFIPRGSYFSPVNNVLAGKP